MEMKCESVASEKQTETGSLSQYVVGAESEIGWRGATND